MHVWAVPKDAGAAADVAEPGMQASVMPSGSSASSPGTVLLVC